MRDKNGNKRLLRADEIECRVGQKSKDGKKYSVLLYKTARTDMAILDEVFGWDNWQVEYFMADDKLFCNLGVYSDKREGWVWKASNGSESNIEAEKGQASDAFKRAGFMFGIGRELYSAPVIWLDSDVSVYSLRIEHIAYDSNDRISELNISGFKTGQGERERATLYTFSNGKTYTAKVSTDIPDLNRIRDIAQSLELDYGKDINGILAYYNAKTIGDVALEKWEMMLRKAKGNA